MRDRTIPELVSPFTLVGLAAGWLCAGFLSHPSVGWFHERPQLLAAAVAAVAGGIVGALVTRSSRPREADAWKSRWSPAAILMIAVPVAGAVTGAIVSLWIWPRPEAVLAGAVPGAACGLAFLPVCGVVLAAARRAERARLGSIVASTDRRAVWRTLAGCIAFASLLAAPDWAARANGIDRDPAVGAAIALIAALFVAAILALDARAAMLIARIAARGAAMEQRDPADEAANAPVPRVDLGLGDGVRAEVTRGVAYRSSDRVVALMIGEPDEAVAAVGAARRRSGAILAGAAAVLAAQAFAMTDRPAMVFAESRCASGLVSSCIRAADLHVQAGDLRRALAFRTEACDRAHAASCDAAGELRGSLGMATPREKFEAACDRGDTTSCRAVARLLLDRPSAHEPHARDKALMLLRSACIHGDEAGCRELDLRTQHP